MGIAFPPGAYHRVGRFGPDPLAPRDKSGRFGLMPPAIATIHASAVLVGARAVLIRGPSGSGKSRLALELIEAARSGALRFARLVADDRVRLEATSGRLLARPAPALSGLIELRGIGILRIEHEPCAAIGLVVDLAATDAERLPRAENRTVDVIGIILPRLAVAPGNTGILLSVLALRTASGEAVADRWSRGDFAA